MGPGLSGIGNRTFASLGSVFLIVATDFSFGQTYQTLRTEAITIRAFLDDPFLVLTRVILLAFAIVFFLFLIDAFIIVLAKSRNTFSQLRIESCVDWTIAQSFPAIFAKIVLVALALVSDFITFAALYWIVEIAVQPFDASQQVFTEMPSTWAVTQNLPTLLALVEFRAFAFVRQVLALPAGPYF